MRGMVPDALGKDKIYDIMQEEMGHIVTLTDELHSLS